MAGNASLLDVSIDYSRGLGLISTQLGRFELHNVSVRGTLVEQIDYDAVWAATCGGFPKLSEIACSQINPPPTNSTLCQIVGMDSYGSMNEPWFGNRIRMCPGAPLPLFDRVQIILTHLLLRFD
jgi:hypothetical protein